MPGDSDRSRETWLLAASVAGATLVGLVGRRYGIDRVDCRHWPALRDNLACAAVYLAGVALLTVGWLGMLRDPLESPLCMRRLVGRAALVHVAALVGPPFLSRDPLCYAAIGRAMARFGQAASAPLAQSLPAGDPFLSALAPNLQSSGSAYWDGFNQLAAVIARIGRDDVATQLRLYQLVGLVCVLVAGALVGLAAGRRAAVLVLFSPLAVIEATQGGHNDALMMVCVALFALLLTRNRLAATLALAAALLVKASAVILLSMQVAQALLRRARRAAESRGWQRVAALMVPLTLVAAAIAVAGVVVIARRSPPGRNALQLIGSPNDAYDYCTRSIECFPRVILRWILHLPTAAWALGVGFRILGAVWLGYVATRAARATRPDRQLGWLATGLFVYYLFLHGWSQSWYLLSLLPLMPFAHPRLAPAMVALCISAVAYYAVAIPFDCVTSPLGLGVRDLLGGAVATVPPVLLLMCRRRAGATESAAASPAAPRPDT